MDNFNNLQKHINSYLEKKYMTWTDLPCEAGLKSYLLGCIAKWEKLFEYTYLRDERFLAIAEPFTDETPIDPCQYYMRGDGSIVFVEATYTDGQGDLIAGHPLRFPFDPSMPARYLSNNIEPDIFGIPMKCTTKVFWDGRKNYDKQTEECQRVVSYQHNSKYPIMPLYFHSQDVGGKKFRIIQTPVFRRENFVAYFPFRKAMDYLYKQVKFEPVVKGTDWIVEKSHTYPFSGFDQIPYERLGLTGSSSFGDINDKEDFDVVFLDNNHNLVKYRQFIHEGVRQGLFRYVSRNRGLRVYHQGLPIECNDNKPLLLCTFLNLSNIESDPLYRTKVNILGKLDYCEVVVGDDHQNMITPPHLQLTAVRNIAGRRNFEMPGHLSLVPMMGTCRGLYVNGQTLRLRDPLVVEFTPRKKKPFHALVSLGWYDIDIA